MADFTRLFDLFDYQNVSHPREDALNYKYGGVWKNYSSQDCVDFRDKVSRALLASGLKPDDKVALISANRPEWNFMDYGMLQVGIINVPIYPTISEREYEHIFNEAEIKMAFVADQGLCDKILAIKDRCPNLQEVFAFEENVNGCEHWTAFLAREESGSQEDAKAIADKIQPNDLATIIYTSGTTGLPKGVMLSHNNIVSQVKAVMDVLPLYKEYRSLSFLPLCHIFERTVTYTYVGVGVGVYYAESMETIADNLKEVKPHFFSSVPRLLEKVYDKIMGKGMDLTGLKKRLFFWAVDLAQSYEEGQKPTLKTKIADKLIYSKWREALGGNVLGIVTGASACQERLARVFSAAGIPIREGYGQTESSPVITVNRFDEGMFKFGTVGVTIPGVEFKIAPTEGHPEGTGEILAKGPNIMLGYYKKPEETAKTIVDGWLHTGDVGTIIDGKFLKITDRIKDLFKTSGGKYVAPQVVEEKMKESRFIEQIMVIGENEKFVSALIVPAFAALQVWAENEEDVSDTSPQGLVSHPAVDALIQADIKELNTYFSKIEQIKAFRLLSQEWTEESGCLTPTKKVKRKVVMEQNADLIASIYSV